MQSGGQKRSAASGQFDCGAVSGWRWFTFGNPAKATTTWSVGRFMPKLFTDSQQGIATTRPARNAKMSWRSGTAPLLLVSPSKFEGWNDRMTHPKRPRDTNQLAKLVVDIATGEKPDRDPTPEEHAIQFVVRKWGIGGATTCR